MYVGFVDGKENIIYNKAYSSDGANPESLTLENAIEEGTLGIYDDKGNKLDFSEITEGTVIDVRKNEDIIQIVVNKNSKEITITKKGKDDFSRDYVGDAEGEYVLDDAYLNAADNESFTMGDKVKLYFNSFGKVAWVEKTSTYTMEVGYLL